MKLTIVCGALLTLVLAHLYGIGIRYNNSESLPQTLFLAIPIKEIHKGDIVTFQLPEKSRVTFAKIVTGLPGDVLTVKEGKICVNNEAKGAVVETVQAIDEGIIPDGYCFMIGQHEKTEIRSRFVFSCCRRIRGSICWLD
jgi:signal peptidase I